MDDDEDAASSTSSSRQTDSDGVAEVPPLHGLTAFEHFHRVDIAGVLPLKLGTIVNDSITLRLATVPADLRDKKDPVSMRSHEELIMRLLVLHYPRNSPTWLVRVAASLVSVEFKLAYLAEAPGISEHNRSSVQEHDWDHACTVYFGEDPERWSILWQITRPAIDLAITRLTDRLQRRNPTAAVQSPKFAIHPLHSRLKKTLRRYDNNLAKPTPYTWFYFRFRQNPIRGLNHILPSPKTIQKLFHMPGRRAENLGVLMWVAVVQFLATNSAWKTGHFPFPRGKRGFWIMYKDLILYAVPGDKRWNLDVCTIINSFAEDCVWFAPWTEDGVEFTRLAYTVVANNYFLGRWLDTLGVFPIRIEEHFSGTCGETIWLLTYEHHKAKGTLHVLYEWLRNALYLVLDRILDEFIDVLGWTYMPNLFPSPVLFRRSTSTSRKGNKKLKLAQDPANPNNSSSENAGHQPSPPATRLRQPPPLISITSATVQREDKGGGNGPITNMSSTSPLGTTNLNLPPTSHAQPFGPSPAWGQQQNTQEPKQRRRSRKRKRGQKWGSGEAKTTSYPTTFLNVNTTDQNTSLPSRSSLPLAAPPHPPTSAITQQQPVGSASQPTSIAPDVAYPSLVWMSPLLQATFSFPSEFSMSSFSSISSLQSMQSLQEAVDEILADTSETDQGEVEH